MRQAILFQDLYRLDRMKRVMAFEVLLSATVLSVALGLRSNLLHYYLTGLAVFTVSVAALWVKWEVGRKRRRLVMGTVIRTLDPVRTAERFRIPVIAGKELPRWYTHAFRDRGFVVDVVASGMRIRYIDHTPRSQGESVLLLLDSKGNVLASAGSESRVPLELLMKLA